MKLEKYASVLTPACAWLATASATPAWSQEPAPAPAVAVAADATPAAADPAPRPPAPAGTPLRGAAPVDTALPLAAKSPVAKPIWQGHVSALATAQQIGSYAVDAFGATAPDSAQAFGRLRLGISLDSGPSAAATLKGGFAAEIASGSWSDAPTLVGDRAPGSDTAKTLPAEAWLGVAKGKVADVRAGLQASHWGLGLLANDGRVHDLAWFSVPRVGDRVLRGAITLSPWRGKDTPLAGLTVSLALDDVLADDLELPGDEGRQSVAALRWHAAPDRWLGFYFAGRSQQHTSGRRMDANAFDLTGDITLRPAFGSLRLQGEAVLLTGTTTLAPTPEYPTHDIEQFAVLLRATAKGTAGWLAVLDAGWFSGDQSLDDGKIQGFRADPNFQMGMLLFPQVLAWQSARARLGASDPSLVGRPADDLERLATGGSVASTIAVFPKAGWNALPWLEIYAGALLAASPSPLTDPRASRTQTGGEAVNFLGKTPDGIWLGTELAGGFRLKFAAPRQAGQLVIGAEAAHLLPGGVLAGLDAVSGLRVTAGWLPEAE